MQSLTALVTFAAYQVCKRVWPMEVFQIMFLRFDSKSGHKIYELVFNCENVYVTESLNLPSVIKYTWILVSSQQLLLRGNCKPLAHLVLLNAAHLQLFSLLISNQSEGINRTFKMGKPIRHGKRGEPRSLRSFLLIGDCKQQKRMTLKPLSPHLLSFCHCWVARDESEIG